MESVPTILKITGFNQNMKLFSERSVILNEFLGESCELSAKAF